MPGSGRRNERLAFLFVLGLLGFNAPILSMFDQASTILGVPVLYAYLFAAWAGLIGLAALAIEGPAPSEDDGEDGERASDRSSSVAPNAET